MRVLTMMLPRPVSLVVCAVSILACGPSYQQDTNTPDNPLSSPRKGVLTFHAPDKPVELRVRRLRPGLRADIATLSGSPVYGLPAAMLEAFGPEGPLHVTDRGVSLLPEPSAELDAVWFEAEGFSGPRVAHWKPAEGQVFRIANAEVSGNPYQAMSVNASTESSCLPQPPSRRFGWSETVLIGSQLRVDKAAPGADASCRVLDLVKDTATAKLELCPGPQGIREGDLLRIELRDLDQPSYHQRARILMIETPRETVWMVRGSTHDLGTILAPMGMHSMSWALPNACTLSPADGCGVGGIPAQLQVAFKPGDRSFTLRAGEAVRGNFEGAELELQVVRASFRPFRSADCAYDAADFGFVLTRAGTVGVKATIAR